ncbi:hypothetical protein QTI24_10885 [Variovorax sp. J22P240]|uniref:hypothetical protein n=1 Tax=Variovorax sp. J22P240 TaxID=3053514 RepID=UPI002574E5CE|nr:hypothetical protein [Variovorax sp. J22P240]MDL9999108.1 hypothetical protein [Variovorax sp. J22P240]
MRPDLRLGYLVFEVRRIPRWMAFCEQMLGLPAPVSNADGSFGWQLDEASQRLIVQEGEADDLGALGLECSSDEVLAPATAPFESADFPEGFRTGDLGLGHAVLVAHDIAAMEFFYVDLLGFGVTERLCDIGRGFERARRHKVPLSLELGQHPDPDGTFSFYGATPSGFDFEIGAGTQTIDPAGWEIHHTHVTSTWATSRSCGCS